jgi:CMP-N,N'-diacetyllegionaminic acid synthase
VITARGGSKGVPRKNVQLLCGKPLIQYTADVALATLRLDRLILSTDDEEIAAVGRQCGLDVPFMRPTELAQDRTPSLPVLQHAVQFLEDRNEHYDAICLLQPTNPLRRAEHIDGCIELLETSGADAVITVLAVPAEYNPHWTYFRDQQGFLRLSTGEPSPIPRRQDLPPAFHRDGSVYVMRRDVLMEQNSLYGARLAAFPMDSHSSVNIDSLADWERASELLSTSTR